MSVLILEGLGNTEPHIIHGPYQSSGYETTHIHTGRSTRQGGTQ